MTSIDEHFFNWLKKTKKKSNGNEYSKETIGSYLSEIDYFCKTFYDGRDFKLLADEIEVPIKCCHLCQAIQEPDELLREYQIRILAKTFWQEYFGPKTVFKHERVNDSSLLENMTLFFTQKKMGKRYQNVMNLFYDFITETGLNNKKIIQDENKNAFLKYWYIDATPTEAAKIVPKAGQDYISTRSLKEIFDCDIRTITKMLKDANIKCCHHRKTLYPVNALNEYLRIKCLRINSKETNTQNKDPFKFNPYNKISQNLEELDYIDKNSSMKEKEKEFRKTRILEDQNAMLCHWLADRKTEWEDKKSISKRIGKSTRTVERQAESEKIPTMNLFLRKTRYLKVKNGE